MDQVLRSHSRLGLSLESNTMSNLKPDSAPRVVLRIQGFQCEQAAAGSRPPRASPHFYAAKGINSFSVTCPSVS